MKTQTQHLNRAHMLRGTNRFRLTAGMMICVTAGWCLGHLTTKALAVHAAAGSSNNIILHSIPVNGKALPTIMLQEFSVVAEQTLKK